ncbi:MAG: furin-like repeat-containing protein [Polaribacter sp.]|nr:furin-like repeat-containing protein [Polaribacter sp.]
MKKRKLKNYLKIGILLFGISLFLQNCEKERFGTFNPESNKDIQNLTFKEAIDFFNKNKPISNLLAKGSEALTVNPDWETISHQQLVYSEASLVKADTDINREGNYYSQLIFININGQIKNVICTSYKDKTDADGNMVDGRLYFNNIDGTFIDAYKIENKLFTKRLIPNQEAKVNQASFFLFLFQQQDEQFYWCYTEGGMLNEVEIKTYKPHMLTAGGNLSNYSSAENYQNYVNNATGMNTGSSHSSGLTNKQITDAAGAIISSPPIDEDECPNGLKNDFGECVDRCRSGKTYNETTKKCECTDSSKIEDWQGNCIDNPCNKITNLFNNNTNIKQELITLKGFTSATTERGRYKLTTASVIQSPPTGSDGYVDIPIPAGNAQYEFFAHTHNSPASATLSIPSFADIVAMAGLLEIGKIDASNFVFFLMTADQTNYAITINDPTQFLSVFKPQMEIVNGEPLVLYNKKIENLIKTYYRGKRNEDGSVIEEPLIKEGNLDKLTDEKLFLDFLDATQMGLSLFEVNNTFDEFTRVTHNKTTDDIDKDNCN